MGIHRSSMVRQICPSCQGYGVPNPGAEVIEYVCERCKGLGWIESLKVKYETNDDWFLRCPSCKHEIPFEFKRREKKMGKYLNCFWIAFIAFAAGLVSGPHIPNPGIYLGLAFIVGTVLYFFFKGKGNSNG